MHDVLLLFSITVAKILIEELEKNKKDAETYLDVMIDMHKRVIMTKHVEFKTKLKVRKRGTEIRFENKTNPLEIALIYKTKSILI